MSRQLTEEQKEKRRQISREYYQTHKDEINQKRRKGKKKRVRKHRRRNRQKLQSKKPFVTMKELEFLISKKLIRIAPNGFKLTRKGTKLYRTLGNFVRSQNGQ